MSRQFLDPLTEHIHLPGENRFVTAGGICAYWTISIRELWSAFQFSLN